MSENLRRFYGGRDLHFLTFSCYQRRPLFSRASRPDLFLDILERVRCRYRLVILGYVVMPEHVHLLVTEPQRSTLSTTVQALKLGFVRSLEGTGGSQVSQNRRDLGHPTFCFELRRFFFERRARCTALLAEPVL